MDKEKGEEMKNRLNILCQSSDFYSPFCGVMLESLFYNNVDIEIIKVYLISDNITEVNLIKFEKLSQKYHREIQIIDGKEICKKLEQYNIKKYHNAYTVYFKLFALDYILDDINQLLYLDSDMLVKLCLS